MNQTFFRKNYSTFIALLLVLFLSTSLSTVVKAENEVDEKAVELENSEVNEDIVDTKNVEIIVEEEKNETTDELGDEIVEFKHDVVRDTVKSYLGIESDIITKSDMEKLDYIYVSWGKLLEEDEVVSLKGLEYAVNLTSLRVSDTNIEDTWVLEKLENLGDLWLNNVKVEDFSFIKNLTRLRSLNLDDNNISDISFLENLTNLGYLNLNNNDITDISSLENLTNLGWLELSYTNISDISVLKNLTNIDILTLSRTNITDISVLEHLQKLEELVLDETNIKSIKVLRKLPKLSNVILIDNDVAAYDFETLHYLINRGVLTYEAHAWYLSQVKDIFSEGEGFKLDEKKAQVTAHVKDDSYKLTRNQVASLWDNDLTIVLQKKGVEISIPAKAFIYYRAAEITIEKLADVDGSYSDGYKFTIMQGDERRSQFEEPITLTFKVSTDGVTNADNLQVFYLNEETGKWENIGGKYHAEEGTVTATTTHFSTFAVFEAEEIGSDNLVVTDNESSAGEVESEDKLEGTQKTPEESETTETPNTPNTPDNNDNATTQTDGGTLLPNTATSMFNSLTIGLIILLLGASIFAIRHMKDQEA